MRDWTETQVTLVFIRHGETKANREHRYLGKTDESLSERGIETLRAYQQRKDYPDVQYLFTSPMKRCMETAQILYPSLCPVVIPEWKEINFGQFEYRNYEELKEDAQYRAWLESGGTLAFPEGESREQFIRRCERGFVRMCDELRRAIGWDVGETVCAAGQNSGELIRAGLIVHGGTIMALMSLHGGKEYFDCQAANGRGYVCRMQGWGRSARIEEAEKL